jgi:hypothetical protein
MVAGADGCAGGEGTCGGGRVLEGGVCGSGERLESVLKVREVDFAARVVGGGYPKRSNPRR